MGGVYRSDQNQVGIRSGSDVAKSLLIWGKKEFLLFEKLF